MTFWERLLDAWERSLDEGVAEPALRWLVLQGRWWHQYESSPERVIDFDLHEWAEQVRQTCYFEVHLDPALAGQRRGQPEAMLLLVRTLCRASLGQRAVDLQVEGDQDHLAFRVVGGAVEHGPLADQLVERLGATLGLGTPLLFRCPCPAGSFLSSGAPIDLNTLQLSTMNDRDFERELITTFLAEGRRQFSSLAQNYSVSTLHSLKGSAAMVGAVPLARLLDEQEHALDSRRLPDLEAEFKRVVSWLEQRLRAGPAGPPD